MKKIAKMSLSFEFSVPKLGYIEILMKVWEKDFWFIFYSFLTNWGKWKDEDENIFLNGLDFWIHHIKTKLYGNFQENLRKKLN